MISQKTFHFFSRYAITDPVGFCGTLRRHFVESRSPVPKGKAITTFGEVRFEVDLTMHRMMAKYYFRTHEMFLERVFRKCLAPGDTFVDIGANCGYWSAFCTNLVGRTGTVHAFEPVPVYFAVLKRLAELNPDHRIICNNAACGAAPSTATMSAVLPKANNFANLGTNIGSSSLADGFLEHASHLTTTIETKVVRFDDYIIENAIEPDRIGLIKIDVEGYEGEVLKGMTALLTRPGKKVPILCEVLTDLKRRNPLNGAHIIAELESYGYRCVDAASLLPLRGRKLDFEENILCL